LGEFEIQEEKRGMKSKKKKTEEEEKYFEGRDWDLQVRKSSGPRRRGRGQKASSRGEKVDLLQKIRRIK